MNSVIRFLKVALGAVLFPLSGLILDSTAMAQSVSSDLAIQVSSLDPTIPAPGALVTFTVKVSNLASFGGTVRGHVVATLPPEYTEIYWSCAGAPIPTNATCPAGCHLPSCPVPNSGTGNLDTYVELAPGTSVIFTVKARVPENTPNPLVFTCSVTPTDPATDPNPGNNQDSVVLWKSTDVSLALQSSTPTSTGHEPVVITASVCNGGPWSSDAVNVLLTFVKGITFYNTSGDGWTCTVTEQQATCQRPTVARSSCSLIQTTVVPGLGMDQVSVQGVLSFPGRIQDISSMNNRAQVQFNVIDNKASLNGGGFCSLGNPGSSTGFVETLGLICGISMMTAVYRISRRRQTT